MTRRYAEKTTVASAQTQMQIQALVQRYGGEEFTVSLKEGHALLGFRLGGRAIRLTLPLPKPGEPEFRRYYRGMYTYERTDSAAQKLWEQACRANWRALLLVVRAKLEAIAIGILDVDEAFFGDVMTAAGGTVYERHAREVLPELPAPARLSLPDTKG